MFPLSRPPVSLSFCSHTLFISRPVHNVYLQLFTSLLETQGFPSSYQSAQALCYWPRSFYFPIILYDRMRVVLQLLECFFCKPFFLPPLQILHVYSPLFFFTFFFFFLLLYFNVRQLLVRFSFHFVLSLYHIPFSFITKSDLVIVSHRGCNPV